MREKKINAMLSDIASIKAKNDNDFDVRPRPAAPSRVVCLRADRRGAPALTSIYRKVFAYLSGAVALSAGRGESERAGARAQVAAALESVFPKIGLRAFVAMPTTRRRRSCASWRASCWASASSTRTSEGRAGLEEIPALAQEEARAMEGRVRADKEELRAQVLQYLEVVNHGALPEKARPLRPMRHLRTELINRRQVGSCLDTVEQDLSGMLSHVDECVAGFDREMAELKASSAPRPRCRRSRSTQVRLAGAPLALLSDERQAVACLARVLETVERFRALRRTELTPKALEAARAARAADAAAARQLKDFEAAEAAAAGFQALAAGPAQDARTFARAAEERPPPPRPPAAAPAAPERPRAPRARGGAVDRVGGGAGGEEPAAAAAAPAGEPTDEADETGVSSIVREAGAQAAAEEAAEPARRRPRRRGRCGGPAAAAADGEAAAAPEEPAPAEAPRRRARRRRLPPRARRRGGGQLQGRPRVDEAAPAPAEAARPRPLPSGRPQRGGGEAASAAGRRPLRARASGRTAGVGAAARPRARPRGSGAAGFGRGAACVGRARPASGEARLRRAGAACVGRGAACVGRGAGGGGGGGDRRVGEERGEGAERGRLAAAEHGAAAKPATPTGSKPGTPTGSASAAAARPPSGAPSAAGRRQGPAKADADCQTSTHPIEKHIDPKYTWNEWELRRRALQLTNLRYKKTHSAQTVFSHFRRDNETQHYPPRTRARRRASTPAPTAPHAQLHRRLRGDPDSKMHVVT
eukprot:tig00020611_g12105.t1